MAEKQETPLPIYSVNQLNELIDPVWQVDGFMVRRSLTGIHGPTGHGKTFVALHLALCVAIGMPFLSGPAGLSVEPYRLYDALRIAKRLAHRAREAAR